MEMGDKNVQTVYLKIGQSVKVVNRKILIQDVAEVYSSDTNLVKKIEEMVLYSVKGDKDERLIFSVVKVIKMIQKAYPDISIQNIGETDFIVDYNIPRKENMALEIVKLCLLCLIIFFGSAFTIMTFNTDVSVGDLFDNIYKTLTGTEKHGVSILEAMYSLGIPIGILSFYNHFRASTVRTDPTPIHVEMRNFEEEINKAIIQDASRDGDILK